MRWRVLTVVAVMMLGSSAFPQNDKWLPNDMQRPTPVSVVPSAQLGGPPSDATVLFGGSNLDAWVGRDGGTPKWKVENGTLEVVPGTGNITTKQSFGDSQIHVEWMEPDPPTGDAQMKGNSGVIIMSLYEVQILDVMQNKTYADGIAGAVYGQYPPLVVAARGPGQWQSYDILFRRPRFDANGYLLSPARMTIIQNGIYVQDDVALTGPTGEPRSPYVVGPESLPLTLQDHGCAVKFRDIWIRQLPDREPDLHYTAIAPYTHVASADLASYVGHYQVSPNSSIDLELEGDTLMAQVHGAAGRGRGGRGAATAQSASASTAPPFQQPAVKLVPINHDVFINAHLQGSLLITFTRGSDGQVSGLTMQQGNVFHYAQKAQ